MFDLNLPKKRQSGGNIIQIMVLISFTAVIFITVLYLWMSIQNEYNTANLLRQIKTTENPYMNDPLYCETVDDCTTHVTDCNPCACGQAVNKQNVQDLNCTETDEPQYICDACPQVTLDCINNQCELVPYEHDFNTNGSVTLTSPQHNDMISSPLAITGSALGTWYFEGDFPVKLYDMNNELIETSIATAKSDWMTEDMVEFEAEIEYDLPENQFGWLILEKDNPSGLAENDDELRIMVRFHDIVPNLYCQTDNDCTIQSNCCPCPHIPTNKDYIIDLDCDPEIACTMQYCGEGEAYCENNTCKVRQVDIVE